MGWALWSAAAAEHRLFEKRVEPILKKRCLWCHEDTEKLKKNIVPGKPEESRLIRSLRHDGDLQMPPGPKLPDKEIKILTEWVRQGAHWSK